MEFKHKKLNNGLNIIGEVNPYAQSAAIGFFVKTGSRDETAEINGVSHFLEHMLFKGTEKLDAMQVNLLFDRLGAQYNAFTSEENTVYYAACLPENFMAVADLWCQLMRPQLRQEDFNMEKNVILEEIAMYKDMPSFDIIDCCRSLHFAEHPCGNSVLGTAENIKALKQTQMKEYFSKRYSPSNITAVAAGNFDFEKLCECIEKNCSRWENFQTQRKTEFFAGSKEKKTEIRKNLNRMHICLISPTVSYQDKDSYAAMLLSKIIGDDNGSRYFWKLIDTAIAETAAMQCEAMDGVGAYYSYLCTAPENGKKVIDTVNQIFQDITDEEKITENELTAAKNKILAAITIKNEVPMGRLVELGFNWLYLQQYRAIEPEIEKIRAVKIDDIYRLLDKYPLNGYTLYTISPQ